MDVDLGDVRAFLFLSEARHFGVAAAGLHVTPSSLTKRLQRLELVIGDRLVARDHGGVTGLTRSGRQFLPGAVVLLEQAASSLEQARAGPHGAVVRLAIPGSSSVSPSDSFLASVNACVAASSPGTRVCAVGLTFEEMWSALPDDRADVVLTTSESTDPRVLSTPVARMDRVGLVGLRHPMADAGAVPVADFAELLLLDNPDLPRPWMQTWWLGDLRGPADARLQSEALPTIADVLRHLVPGRAATVTQSMYAQRPGPFAAVRLIGVPTQYHYADRRRADTRTAVIALVKALREALRSEQHESVPRGGTRSDATSKPLHSR